MNRFIFIFSLLLLMIASSCITEDEPDTTSLKPGDKCPEFSVKMHDGSIVTTADLKGEKSIILFFNTSCADCRSELPQMQRVYEHIIAENIPVRLLCISRAEREESIERFWQENGLTLPYSAQEDRTVYNLFAQSGIPRIYILSPALPIIR
ncbi:MAG: redoxin domain-containing protein, partial [Muribaculaceae bacterium]|nr:redoxin domain-containing protein [Muribaculaceae bacterium]